MTTGKVIGKPLKFKGFKAVDLAFKRDNELHIAVKSFKNGCQCPQCGRRGKIGRCAGERYSRRWLDRVVHVRSSRDPMSNPRTC